MHGNFLRLSHLLNVGPRTKRCAACLSVNLWVFYFLLYFIPRSTLIIWATMVCDTPYFLARSRWQSGSVQSMSFATLFTRLFVGTSGVPGFSLCFLLEDFFRPFFSLALMILLTAIAETEISSCARFLLTFLHDFKKWYISKTRPLMNSLVFSTIFKHKIKSFFCNLAK